VTVRSHSVDVHPDFTLAFVEFDDQGRFWNRDQIDLVERTLRTENERADSSGVSVVVFAHGWRHGCDVCDENVACFRTFLKQVRSDSVATSRVSAGRVRPKRIVAIYTGWRGRSAKIQPLEDLSFWARKQVARRIAEGDFIELLTRVELFVRQANQTDPERVRLAVIGHSFGGTIVYASLANILKARVLEARNVSAGGDRVIRGYGDLIVLINPAFEASLYAPLNELAAGFGAFSPLQPPVLLTIASETDRPNRVWFPLGRYLETLFQNMGDRSPRAAANTAVGNYSEFWTHRLTAAVPPSAGARRDLFGSSSKNCACQLPLDPIDDREAATLVALLSGEGTQAPTPGEAAAPYGRALLTCLKPIGQGNPFWVVRASGDVMHGHSGIFTTYLVDFIRRVFIEANARSHPRRQVAAQPGVR